VRVPCSTSNLGAGFDCMGLALDRYLEVAFEPGGEGLEVERTGTLKELRLDAASDRVVAAFLEARAAHGGGHVGGVFRMHSTIPVGRGLGSSAAATVAGLLLGAAVSGARSARAVHLEAATRIEGHPDNVGPALMGGQVGVSRLPGGAHRSFGLPLSPELGFAFAAPLAEVSTVQARRVLPQSVPHVVAVRSIGRVAALVRGLESGDAELLRAGFADELHVPYRMALIPGAEMAMDAARGAGAYAVTISGSGSGLIAVCERAAASAVAAAMAQAFRTADPGAAGGVIGHAMKPDFKGARVLERER